jgi:hypothetical protein
MRAVGRYIDECIMKSHGIGSVRKASSWVCGERRLEGHGWDTRLKAANILGRMAKFIEAKSALRLAASNRRF